VLSTVHGPWHGQCKLSVMIPFDPIELWSGSIISSEPDTSVELMAHMPLTSLCDDRLAASPDLESREPRMAAAS
jgi:hypothetical protein